MIQKMIRLRFFALLLVHHHSLLFGFTFQNILKLPTSYDASRSRKTMLHVKGGDRSGASGSTASSSSSSLSLRDEPIRQLLESARQWGPLGTLAPDSEQEIMLKLSREMVSLSEPHPANVSLAGKTFDLIYSDHPGRPSGRLFGRVHGKMTQSFLTNGDYVNAVTLGPLTTTITAHKTTLDGDDGWTNEVTFYEAAVKLFGKTLIKKKIDLGKSGTWKYLCLCQIQDDDDDGRSKIIRIMETPKLFILQERV